MDLGLLTLQRRFDIANMQFSDIKNDYLYVIQQKTKKHGASAHIKIKIGDELQQVIERCRSNIVSPFLVSRIPERLMPSQNRNHFTQVSADYLSKKFSEARDKCSLFQNMPEEKRPTFHEIRSLGIKLYEDQGIDAQKLAGHTDRRLTENYKVGHQIDWIEAATL